MWRDAALAAAGAIVLGWLVLVALLLLARPSGPVLKESLRLLPDLIRLLRNLTLDRDLPRGVRIRVAVTIAYLALPFDLIPDFIPVLGYADDAIIVVVVLRSIARRVGTEALRAHWPGTDDGFTALCRAVGLSVTAARRSGRG